jgi:hypothetical protein
LATFKTLTPEVIEHARTRSRKPPDADELRTIARRAGAPVASPPCDQAAAKLLAELAAGRRPRPGLARMLLGALQAEEGTPSGNAEAAAAWLDASPRQRGETLRELLLLVDYLPHPKRPRQARFPRIESRPA